MAVSASASFESELRQEVLRASGRFLPWHLDPDRYPRPRLRTRLRKRLRSALSAMSRPRVASGAEDLRRVDGLGPHIARLEGLHGALGDDASRDDLVRVVAYRLLGPDRCRLPLDTRGYWKDRERLRSLASRDSTIAVPGVPWPLEHYDLNPIGFPIRLHTIALGAHHTFRTRQYEYRRAESVVRAEPGDVVVDAGGCWGDTALYFAHEVGSAGKVYTLEFLPENVEVMARNLRLNPVLAERIVVVERPLWSTSGLSLGVSGAGPGAHVGGDAPAESAPVPPTITVDDLAAGHGLRRIDFLKMDIEGAETEALKGAVGSLRRWKPKLAIAIYHSLDDLTAIHEFVASLDLGYRFHLRHCSTYDEETILFGLPAAPARG